MGGARSTGDEQPVYDPDDPENFFTFRVHHGEEFDERMEKYSGGSICFFDYVCLDELSLLDIDDIAISLGYKLPMGYWIQLPRYGMLFNIACDKDFLWFEDKVLEDRVVDLYVERIEPLQTIDGNEFIPSQQPESQVHRYGITDDDHNRAQAAEEGDRPEVFGDGPHVDRKRAYSERDRKGKRVQVDPESGDDGGDLVESDYEQEVEDIAAETCYDPSNLWDTFTFPRTECGSGSDYENGSENLSSLDGSEAEEDE